MSDQISANETTITYDFARFLFSLQNVFCYLTFPITILVYFSNQCIRRYIYTPFGCIIRSCGHAHQDSFFLGFLCGTKAHLVLFGKLSLNERDSKHISNGNVRASVALHVSGTDVQTASDKLLACRCESLCLLRNCFYCTYFADKCQNQIMIYLTE